MESATETTSRSGAPLREEISDERVVARVLAGETAMFEILMRRYNQRLYRVVRSIVRNEAECEDVVQDAYVRAYENLAQYRGAARFSTWLTRIAVNEAIRRVRNGKRWTDLPASAREPAAPPYTQPHAHAARGEARAAMEAAISRLPDAYRSVFVLRHVEELSTVETAECLEIPQDTVKSRLHRGRSLLRRELSHMFDPSRDGVFEFGFGRCDRMVRRVLTRVADRLEDGRRQGARS